MAHPVGVRLSEGHKTDAKFIQLIQRYDQVGLRSAPIYPAAKTTLISRPGARPRLPNTHDSVRACRAS
jgi:hypothetical protein